MYKEIIEILPNNKKDIKDALEAKIVLDCVENGEITDEFFDLIKKDMESEEIVGDEETIKNSVWDKIKGFFKAG